MDDRYFEASDRWRLAEGEGDERAHYWVGKRGWPACGEHLPAGEVAPDDAIRCSDCLGKSTLTAARINGTESVLTPAEVAADLGYTLSRVEGLIAQGMIYALRPLVRGEPMRIPVPALDAYKRRVGLLPPIPRSTARPHVYIGRDPFEGPPDEPRKR
jgi:excisionase family DNA binding protein